MKIFKFRKLTNEIEYSRLEEIIKTGEFWCSKFWELNDPMEGIFSINEKLINKINDIYKAKSEYKICSFSGSEAFKNPAMWGYYAGEFKGVVIEIDVNPSDVQKINYSDNDVVFDKECSDEYNVKNILLSKKLAWRHENEYRYLGVHDNSFCKIGKIKKIHFGAPYKYLGNSDEILKEKKSFSQHKKYKGKIINILKKRKISYSDVKVIGGKVVELS